MNSGKIDKYSCKRCGGSILTIHTHTGIAPPMIGCLIKGEDGQSCGHYNIMRVFIPGEMFSANFETDQSQIPTWQWKRPTQREISNLPKEGRRWSRDPNHLVLFRILGATDAKDMQNPGVLVKMQSPRPAEQGPSKARSRKNRRRENAKAFDPPAVHLPVSVQEIVQNWSDPTREITEIRIINDGRSVEPAPQSPRNITGTYDGQPVEERKIGGSRAEIWIGEGENAVKIAEGTAQIETGGDDGRE